MWVRRAEVDDGRRPGLATDERARMKDLERENRELRRANGWRIQPVSAPVLTSEPLDHRSVVVPGILTHEQKRLAFRLRARGWPLVDIAREVGCTAPMVGLMVRKG